MKLVQLEYFCAVCRYHSITRAAEELYVTQPTISVAIRELEKELKLRLFHHEKNRISLTQEGEAFYRRAEAVLKEKGYNVARRTVAKYREQLSIPIARLRKEL